MNLKKIITYLTTLNGEAEDAAKEKKKVVDIFDADKTTGEILFRKEFLILDHEIKGSIAFKGRYLAYKDLILTSKGIYIVGVPSIEYFDYGNVSSITLAEPVIRLTMSNKDLYIYETTLSNGYTGHNIRANGQIVKGRKDDFLKIKTILEAHGLHQ